MVLRRWVRLERTRPDGAVVKNECWIDKLDLKVGQRVTLLDYEGYSGWWNVVAVGGTVDQRYLYNRHGKPLLWSIEKDAPA